MIASFVKHKVDDFEAWKKVYEEFSKVRKEKGVIGDQLKYLWGKK